MAQALIQGCLRAGLLPADAILATDVDPARRQAAAALGIQVLENNAAAVRQADVILLAVKPAHVSEVLHQVRAEVSPRHLVISIAAGVRLATLEAGLVPGVPVIRVMPNTPCLVGAGAAGLSPGTHARPEHLSTARALFDAVGRSVILPEPLLDAVTGLSGSGPAYGFLIIEALADGGVAAGLPREVAQLLAAQTLLGAAHMVLSTGRHPGELKDQVMSPAGTTAEGLAVLEARAVRAALRDAVVAATRRSVELGGGPRS